MLTIDAINEMIGWVGESPIDPTDPDYASHPLYESALRILNASSKLVQTRGWWFNTFQIELTPTSNAITIGSTYLTVEIVPRRGNYHEYTIRDGALFDLTDNTATISETLTANVRLNVPFEDLPESAAQFITATASVRFIRTYDGDRSKIEEVKEDAKMTFIPFHADHIRNVRVNLYAIPNTARVLANNWYSRYRPR